LSSLYLVKTTLQVQRRGKETDMRISCICVPAARLSKVVLKEFWTCHLLLDWIPAAVSDYTCQGVETFLVSLAKAAMVGSFAIWRCRNTRYVSYFLSSSVHVLFLLLGSFK
jgi:hypothetical protein